MIELPVGALLAVLALVFWAGYYHGALVERNRIARDIAAALGVEGTEDALPDDLDLSIE